MEHITKYGTHYTKNEWAKKQEEFDLEKRQKAEYAQLIAGMETYLKKQLVEKVGMTNERGINVIVGYFKSCDDETLNVRVKPALRKAKFNIVMDLYERWTKKTNALMLKQADEERDYMANGLDYL